MSTSTFTLPVVTDSELVGKVSIPEIANDPGSFDCVCGEFSFIAADKTGTPIFLGKGDVAAEGTVLFPAKEEVHAICYSCGCMYSDNEIVTQNKATVLVQFDTDTDEFNEAVVAYSRTNGN